MSDVVILWIHLLAATLWIGPQVFLFAAAIPAIRTVEDAETRTRLMKIMTSRFGVIGGGAMVVVIITGVINLYNVDGYSASALINGDDDLRFTKLFWDKMTLLALTIGLTAVHAMYVGPRQLRLAQQPNPDEAEMRNARRLSIALSGVGLLASIGVLYLGAALGHHEYSLVPG